MSCTPVRVGCRVWERDIRARTRRCDSHLDRRARIDCPAAGVKARLKQVEERNGRFFDDENAIDAQRDELIGRIEGQLRQKHTLKPVFTFRWRLA